VLFPGLEVHGVPGPDGFDPTAARLREPRALRDVDRLAERMFVPGGPRAGREVHDQQLHVRARGDRVDVDVAGEPLSRGALRRVLVRADDLHQAEA
jgi:hypothetical protein